MRVEHTVLRGNPLLPFATFGLCALGNALGIEFTQGTPAPVSAMQAFAWPATEELTFRLLPLAAVGIARAFGAGATTEATIALLSAAAFAGYHDDFDLSRFELERFSYYFAGGLAFYGIARTGGIAHSYAAHAGINTGIIVAATL